MHRSGHTIERGALTGGEILQKGGYQPHPADGIDPRTLPFATHQSRNVSIGECDYHRVFPATSFTSGAQVLTFECPALQGMKGSQIDLKTSKIIVSFDAAGLNNLHTPAYAAGLLFASDIRMYLNGKLVTPSYQGQLPHVAFARAWLRRKHNALPYRNSDMTSDDDQNGIGCISDDLDGLADYLWSPWMAFQTDHTGINGGNQNCNSHPFTYCSYRMQSYLGATRFQIALPLDLLLPLADQPQFLPADICSLRLEITPVNSTFSTMRTNTGYTLTNPSAEFWVRRVKLYETGLSMMEAALARNGGKYSYGCLVPQVYTATIPSTATSFRTTLLASGSRPQAISVHFVAPDNLTLSSFDPGTGALWSDNSYHPFQISPTYAKPSISSMVVRFGANRYPAYYDISRENTGWAGCTKGTAKLDFQMYKESCKAISQDGDQETTVGPFCGLTAFEAGQFNIHWINVTSNQQSVQDRLRSAEKSNLSLDITFNAALANEVGIVVCMWSNEVVEISKTGDVGTSGF